MCMCHGQQPLTRHVTLGQRKTGVGAARLGKKNKKKECWGYENMLVSSGEATYEMKWFMGRFFVRKGTAPFWPAPYFFVSRSISPVLKAHLCSFPRKKKKKRHLVLLNFQLNTGLGRGLLPNKVTGLSGTLNIIYRGSIHQFCTNPCPVWATAQQEWVCVCACVRRGMFPFPLCLKHMNRVGMFGGGAAKGGLGERGKGSNLRGVSHSADQHMVCTVGPTYWEAPRET